MCLCFQPGQPINWVLPCRPQQYNREAIAACFPTFPEEILPNWFSCDRLSWSSAHFFFIPYYWHNISVAEATITRLFKLPGKLRPLAFMEGADIIVLVAAGKEYALWDAVNEDLTRFGSDFASDEAFLARFHPNLTQTTLTTQWALLERDEKNRHGRGQAKEPPGGL
jgi:hypothetical protein